MFRSKTYVTSITRKMTTVWRTRHSKGTAGPEGSEDLQIPSGVRGVGAEHLRKLTCLLNRNEQPNFLTSHSFFYSTLPTHTPLFCFFYLHGFGTENNPNENPYKKLVHRQQKVDLPESLLMYLKMILKEHFSIGKGCPVTPWAIYYNQSNWLGIIIVTLN